MTNTGGQAAVSSASVRTELSAIQSRAPVSVLRGSSDATVRTRVQQGPLGKAACRGVNVGLEEPAIKQPESVYVGMDSLGLCKFIQHMLNKEPCTLGNAILIS